MSEGKKVNHHAARHLLASLFQKRCKHVAERAPRKELVAIDQSHQRHGLFTQRMDDMMVIDHMTMAALSGGTSPFKRHQGGAAQK